MTGMQLVQQGRMEEAAQVKLGRVIAQLTMFLALCQALGEEAAATGSPYVFYNLALTCSQLGWQKRARAALLEAIRRFRILQRGFRADGAHADPRRFQTPGSMQEF